MRRRTMEVEINVFLSRRQQSKHARYVTMSPTQDNKSTDNLFAVHYLHIIHPLKCVIFRDEFHQMHKKKTDEKILAMFNPHIC
jgi:hypothetical protein